MIDLSPLRNQTYAVMGLGKSGLAAVAALCAAGAKPIAWDDKEEKRAEAEKLGATIADLATADLAGVAALVLAPGIPHTLPKPHPVAARAKSLGIPIIGDIELLIRAKPSARIIAITGTNGKSTTTALIGHIINTSGKCAAVGGNLGAPVLLFDDASGIFVIEMSSYQLELTPGLAAEVSILLNITPDHLDRHGDMAAYAAVKKTVFRSPEDKNTAIIGVDDDYCRTIAASLPKSIPMSIETVQENGICALSDGIIRFRGKTVFDMKDAPNLLGRHNWQNACAAWAACHAAGLADEGIAKGLETFPGLAHRQQKLAVMGGVAYINDSKATNADATEKALVCFNDIYWLVGGKPKSDGLADLHKYKDRIRHSFVFGDAEEAFSAYLAKYGMPFTHCGTMDVALEKAHAMAQTAGKGVVLLSPACASFDQFRNFEHRGEVFAELVAKLAKGNST